MWKRLSLAGVTLMVLTAGAFGHEQVEAGFINSEGESVGMAVLTETAAGVLIQTDLFNLPQGWHAFHVHSVGQCAPPSFTSAGGHFNPEHKEHGYKAPVGSHAGDLPNVYVGENGQLKIEALVDGVTLNDGPNRLLDSDGAAILLHEGRDDYATDPAGDAGSRMACGVIGR